MDFKNAEQVGGGDFRIPFGEECAGFVVTLRYLSKTKMREIAKSCKKVSFQNRQQVTELDDEKLSAKIAEAAIADWEGLTPEAIVTLVPELDIKKIEEQLGSETTIKCDAAAKKFLIDSSYQFSNFMDRYIMDISALQDDALKN